MDSGRDIRLDCGLSIRTHREGDSAYLKLHDQLIRLDDLLSRIDDAAKEEIQAEEPNRLTPYRITLAHNITVDAWHPDADAELEYNGRRFHLTELLQKVHEAIGIQRNTFSYRSEADQTAEVLLPETEMEFKEAALRMRASYEQIRSAGWDEEKAFLMMMAFYELRT